MRWACILLPQLALDGVLRRQPDPAAPLALIAGTPQRRVLHAVNPAARALGLRPGMSLSAAQVLAQGFATAEYQPGDARRWHDFLAAWAYRFSSLVSIQYAHALVLEVEASLRLFGPWPRFEARLHEELGALGFRHRIVVAPNPAAARVLANAHNGIALPGEEAMVNALDQLPVERAGFARDTAEAFARMGLRKLRQVRALPRDTLARRFAKDVLQHLDELYGARAAPLAYYAPPDRFDARIELGYETDSHQALLFPLKRLISDLAAYLAGRDGGVQRFALQLEHEEHPQTVVQVGLLAAERDAAMLFELARGRLEQAQVPAPVLALRLLAEELPPFVPAHRELFDERPQQAMPWEQLRERLRARLGDDAVHGLRLHADHRPELAWRAEAGRAQDAGDAPLRPGWLLHQPIPLRDVAPRILSGPERVESGWWDDGDVRRDYYVLQTRLGQRAWAFRPTGEEEFDSPFMLQGWFG
ncbi:Y-family DNA polymerase [Pseudoxanthomonas wuyuanensis]|uniref:Protein ImuB n=1 Tax=Pseudoxanthomonas wuyuanensis TaxID=1073196 RepID=A0A286DEF5_9GAMM|nr:DNA polymerase Y family protein [Pseudoxanthomonas wuyuanensis]KAF1720077.1 DNA repair nucleotidyltransferase [Pseudoxanthomonas wuyuanensis]SOD57024.1 protein ImuB [Pseudoxanthomonas wuyuanensis]